MPASEAARAACAATYTAFIGLGFAFASWASRIPQVLLAGVVGGRARSASPPRPLG